jgi:lipopolysaccharide export system protein LptC
MNYRAVIAILAFALVVGIAIYLGLKDRKEIFGPPVIEKPVTPVIEPAKK